MEAIINDADFYSKNKPDDDFFTKSKTKILGDSGAGDLVDLTTEIKKGRLV